MVTPDVRAEILTRVAESVFAAEPVGAVLHVPSGTPNLFQVLLVHENEVLGVHDSDLEIFVHGKVVRVPVREVEADLKIVVGESVGHRQELLGQNEAGFPGREVKVCRRRKRISHI